MNTQQRPRFRHKVVRDLQWVMASPNMLHAGCGIPVFEDAFANDLVALAQRWLESLDAEPSSLRAFLNGLEGKKRLGHYYGGLVEFWLRHCPAVGAERVLTRHVTKTGKETLSDEDSPIRVLRFVCKIGDEMLHLESAIQFTLAKGPREVDIVASRFSGSFLHDSLCWRILESRGKIKFAQQPQVVEELSREVCNGEYKISSLNSRLQLRGIVFYRLRDWVKFQSNSGDWRIISADSLRGWWVQDIEEALAFPSQESRWLILGHKRFWLSPAVAIEDAAGNVVAEGDDEIMLESLPCATRGKFAASIEAWREKNCLRNPILMAQLVRARDCEGVWVEVSRGFLLPSKWDMERIAVQDSLENIDNGDSVTQLQLGLERILRTAGDGLGHWLEETDRLTRVAEETNCRSREALCRRNAEGWKPAVPEWPLDCDMVQEVQDRWPRPGTKKKDSIATLEKLQNATFSVLAHLEQPRAVILDCLVRLLPHEHQRLYGHFILGEYIKILKHRPSHVDHAQGEVVESNWKLPSGENLKVQKHRPNYVDDPLSETALSNWRLLLESATSPGGTACPKVCAKACRALNLMVDEMPRSAAIDLALNQLKFYGYPDNTVNNVRREATLTGTIQLLSYRLELAKAELLSKDEVMPWLTWFAKIGDYVPATILVNTDICNWEGSKTELVQSFEAAGHGKRVRRVRAGEAVMPAQIKATPVPLPRLRLLPDVTVAWVEDGVAAVADLLFETARSEGKFVALDAEWKPEGVNESWTPVETLQLAVASRCWVFDVPALLSKEPDDFAKMLRRLCSGECTVVGFGLPCDLERISKTAVSQLAGEKLHPRSTHDLLDAVTKRLGLGKCVRAAFGFDLDKTQQCSDWSVRPLTERQLVYAALDAHVLLLLTVGGSKPCESCMQLASKLSRQDVTGARALGREVVETECEAVGIRIRPVAETGPEALQCKTLAVVIEAASRTPRRAVVLLAKSDRLSLERAKAAIHAIGLAGMDNTVEFVLRMARLDELVPLFGHAAGALGPIGLRAGPEGDRPVVIVDADVAAADTVLIGSGEVDSEMAVQAHELVYRLPATVMAVAEQLEEPSK